MLHQLATLWARLAADTIVAGMIARADLSRGMHHFRDAAVLYQDVVRMRPDATAVHIQCGHMFKEAGDLESAWVHYSRAAALAPQDADLHLQIGHFYKVSGKFDDAETWYRRAEALRPGWADPKAELAGLARRRSPTLPS